MASLFERLASCTRLLEGMVRYPAFSFSYLCYNEDHTSASKSSITLLVPDKDADGLSGTLIVFRTLIALGHSEEALKVHFISKGSNPHQEQERQRLTGHGAEYAVVVDQGSRPGPPLVPGTKTLLVDHHLSDEFPEDTLVRLLSYSVEYAYDSFHAHRFSPRASTNQSLHLQHWRTSSAGRFIPLSRLPVTTSVQ